MGIFIGGTGLLGLAIVAVVILIKLLGSATGTYCGACMMRIHPQASICPHCGTERKAAAIAARPRELTGWEVCIVIAAAIAFAGVAVAFFEMIS